jgi:hypothetical protein
MSGIPAAKLAIPGGILIPGGMIVGGMGLSMSLSAWCAAAIAAAAFR